MTVKQAAVFLEVSPRTITRFIAARLFPVTRLGSRLIRINPCDLERFKAKKTKQ